MKFLLSILLLFSLKSAAQWINIDKSVLSKSKTFAYYTFQDSLFLDGQGTLETNQLYIFWIAYK
jgi:hypothetical protein